MVIEQQYNRLKSKFDQKVGELNRVKKQLVAEETQIRQIKKDIHRHEAAFKLVQAVALQTQKQIEIQVSDVASLGMSTVFEVPYNVILEFVQKANRTEGNIIFEEGNNQIDPLNNSGGGVVDIASFCLRAASMSLQSGQIRNIMLLDEPFKFTSAKYQPAVSELLQEISKIIGLQILIVTHQAPAVEYADKVFHIVKEGKTSTVEEDP